MIVTLLYLGAALVNLALCLRIFLALRARPRGYLFLWGLAALMLLAAPAFQISGSLAPLPKAGLQLIYLSTTAAGLLCLGLGIIYRASKKPWAILGSLIWLVMSAATIWGLSAEGGAPLGGLTLAQAGLKPGTGILLIRLAGLVGAALAFASGTAFVWRVFWNSGNLRMAGQRSAALLGAAVLAANLLFSVPAGRVWEHALASLLGGLLLLFGLPLWDSDQDAVRVKEEGELRRLRLRVRLYGMVSVLVVLFGVLFVLPYLPYLSGMVTDVQQNVYFQDLPDDAVGDYLATTKGYMPLFEWYMPLQAAPRDAPTLEMGELQQMVVFQKVLFQQDDYMLYQLETGDRMLWMGSDSLPRRINLQPGMLLPGSYMLIIPTNGMFGGNVYHYFRIDSGQALSY